MNSILRAGLLLALAGNVSASYAQGAAETVTATAPAAAATPATAAPATAAPAAPAPAPAATGSTTAVVTAPAPAPARAVTPSLTTQAPAAAPAPAPTALAPAVAPAADAVKAQTPPKSQPVPMVPLTEKQKAALKPNYELFQAAYAGETWRVRELLRKGANPEARDWQYNFTPLMWAAKKGNLGVVRYLLAHGAGVNTTSKLANNLPFEESYKTKTYDTAFLTRFLYAPAGTISPLQVAIMSGHGQTARELISRGANVNNVALLIAAAYYNDVLTVKALVARGANVNAVDPYGQSALWAAAYGGSYQATKELLRLGAKPSPDGNGIWPSELARKFDHIQVADLLSRPERLEKQRLAKTPSVKAKTSRGDSNAPGADPAMSNPSLKGQGGIIILN